MAIGPFVSESVCETYPERTSESQAKIHQEIVR